MKGERKEEEAEWKEERINRKIGGRMERKELKTRRRKKGWEGERKSGRAKGRMEEKKGRKERKKKKRKKD